MKQAAAVTTGFTTSQEVRISQAVRNRSVKGAPLDRLKKVNDLVGTWEGADPTKCYAGVVPVIGGVERYDLALTTYDLCLSAVIDYTESPDKGVVLNLDCRCDNPSKWGLQQPIVYKHLIIIYLCQFFYNIF